MTCDDVSLRITPLVVCGGLGAKIMAGARSTVARGLALWQHIVSREIRHEIS
jgi:hypothetical protein